MIAQILTVIFGTLALVAVEIKAPDGPRIAMPHRKRVCGHRQGAWVCSGLDCDGVHHYFTKAGR